MNVCSNCGGLWFGPQELTKVVADGVAALDELMGFEPVESHDVRPLSRYMCPVCSIPLHRNQLAGEPEILINTCYGCGGVFLEASVLAKLDDIYKKLGGTPAPTMSPEVQAAAAELDQLTEADHEQAAAMRALLQRRMMFLTGRWGALRRQY